MSRSSAERLVATIPESKARIEKAKASLVQLAFIWLVVLFLLTLVPAVAVSIRVARWAMGG